MKKYHTLEISTNWQELLTRIESENLVLLNQSSTDFIIGWDATERLIVGPNSYAASEIQQFIDKHSMDFVFGNLSYDIKNDETRERVIKDQNDSDHNDAFFLVAKHVIIKKNDTLLYFGNSSKESAEQMITDILKLPVKSKSTHGIELLESTSQSDYLKNLERIKTKIQQGHIYEMNYCVQFKSKFETFNPELTYLKLFRNSEAPFASFVRYDKNYILSASPERFIAKKNKTIISQPIKGTAKRGESVQSDNTIKNQLCLNPKEISENIMIVDLVRNDLSKIAVKNSVKVTELCKAYSFKTVHQLISTISCQIKPHKPFTEIIQALFPMGSMTGAPKISAIENINQFETFKRGIYSGSIGYIEPNGNFDFNVVIRTIVADMVRNQLSCSVGGAITIKSEPIDEYNECKLKLNAIQQTLC